MFSFQWQMISHFYYRWLPPYFCYKWREGVRDEGISDSKNDCFPKHFWNPTIFCSFWILKIEFFGSIFLPPPQKKNKSKVQLQRKNCYHGSKKIKVTSFSPNNLKNWIHRVYIYTHKNEIWTVKQDNRDPFSIETIKHNCCLKFWGKTKNRKIIRNQKKEKVNKFLLLDQ